MMRLPLISSWRVWLVPVVLVLAGFIFRVAYYRGNYAQPDEPITLGVVKAMDRSGGWDTNWSKADLRPDWKYDQYNFSSYLGATFWFAKVARLTPGPGEWTHAMGGYAVHRFFSALLATAVVFQTWWLARRLAGTFAALVAGALVVVAPLLVQDAHYARPEAFVTSLTLLAVAWSLPQAGKNLRRGFVTAVVVGLLVACKVSLLLLAWLPLMPALAGAGAKTTGLRQLLIVALVCAGGLLLGFAIGAPGAVLHPSAFRHGVQQLFIQYGGIQAPQSYRQGGPVTGMLLDYFFATLGWLLLAAGLLGAGVLAARRQWTWLAALAGPVVLFAGYFATRSVFFERNLSHVLPLGCVLAGVGLGAAVEWSARRRPALGPLAQGALLLAVLIQPAQVSVRLVRDEFSGLNTAAREAFEARLRQACPSADWAEVAPLGDEPLTVLAGHFAAADRPLLLKVSDTQDEWSAPFSAHLVAQFDADKIGEWPSTFAELPLCTLLTYVSPHRGYYLVRGIKK